MPRKYTKIKELEPEVFRMKEEGKTNREIAEHFGLTREQIRGLIQRHNRNEQNVRQGTEQTVNLVLNTIKTAMKKEKVTGQLQLHSDQGAQYVSHEYYRLTQSYNITPSMSRRGKEVFVEYEYSVALILICSIFPQFAQLLHSH